MTQEELIDKLAHLAENNTDCALLYHYFTKFFSEHVCIKKGTNRHPYADVLHAYAEGVKIESKGDGDYGTWMDVNAFTMKEYRIKPSEPIYEWKWAVIMDNGDASIYGYHSMDTIKEIFPTRVFYKIEETKRIRQ